MSKFCGLCKKPLSRKPKENKYDWNKRKYCGVPCAAEMASLKRAQKSKLSYDSSKKMIGIEFFLWSNKANKIRLNSGPTRQRMKDDEA